jgi:hypothetical protein
MSTLCKTCQKPKASYDCGLCHEHVCKSCAHFLDDKAFSFLRKKPKELSHSIYCDPCFNERVFSPLSIYEEQYAKSKDIIVFRKNETKKTGHLKRKSPPYKVEDCEDEQEVILRLAFYAVQDGFNCLLDLEINHKKIIVGSHKKTIFSATAVPISIDPSEVREYI